MSKQIYSMSKPAIEYLCGLIKNLTKVSEAIDDINIKTNGTFSSVKINTLLNTLEQDCNDYTDRLVANLSRLELKLVTDEADITESNIMYLYKPDGTTSYNQYVVIDGNKVLLGTCDINMADYYTITQADDKFVLKTDFDTHKNDTTIHIADDERTKWNNTADKVDGADLVKKADIKTTTLNENATDDEIYSGKAIYDAIKNGAIGNNVLGKETVLYGSQINSTGTFTLTDNVNNYDFIVINHAFGDGTNKQSIVLTKNEISICIDNGHHFTCVHGNSSVAYYMAGYFNGDKVIITSNDTEVITSIVGYKFGEVTVANTITNPAPEQSYSLDEQLTGGTWIDGKPIYRKTVDCGVLPNAKSKNVAHGITNIGMVVNIYGMTNKTDKTDTHLTLPSVSTSSTYNVLLSCNGKSITITTGSNRSDFTESYVTIEYTKSTD